eukprot:s684_g12.t1
MLETNAHDVVIELAGGWPLGVAPHDSLVNKGVAVKFFHLHRRSWQLGEKISDQLLESEEAKLDAVLVVVLEDKAIEHLGKTCSHPTQFTVGNYLAVSSERPVRARACGTVTVQTEVEVEEVEVEWTTAVLGTLVGAIESVTAACTCKLIVMALFAPASVLVGGDGDGSEGAPATNLLTGMVGIAAATGRTPCAPCRAATTASQCEDDSSESEVDPDSASLPSP